MFSVALKALTQRIRSVSVTSVFNLFLATENTGKSLRRNYGPLPHLIDLRVAENHRPLHEKHHDLVLHCQVILGRTKLSC
jgi:hypothetical protein